MNKSQCREIYEAEGLQISAKMRNSIRKVEAKLGAMNKRYFVEPIESNRANKSYYDGCTLTCDILQHVSVTVSHDGNVFYCYRN